MSSNSSEPSKYVVGDGVVPLEGSYILNLGRRRRSWPRALRNPQLVDWATEVRFKSIWERVLRSRDWPVAFYRMQN